MMNPSRIAPAPTAGSYRHRAPAVSLNGAIGHALADAGIPVHPFIERGGKLVPASPNGRSDATCDHDQIVYWAGRGVVFAIPTGNESRLWALDLDRPHGPAWLMTTMQHRAVASPSDLTDVWAASRSDGLHAYFRFDPGCPARSRASDIAVDVDSRAAGGSIMSPGNYFADGRAYDLLDLGALAEGRVARRKCAPDRIAEHLLSAPAAPQWLVYLATFSKPERAVIKACPDLREALRDAEPAAWSGILQRHQAAQRETLARRTAHLPHDGEGMRAQAAHDLAEAAVEYAGRKDGRRDALFTAACRLARYVVNDVLPEAELRSALREAAAANGALVKYGARWLEDTITRALVRGRNDALPPLARRFRSTGRAVA
jgi:hypothetical protein